MNNRMRVVADQVTKVGVRVSTSAQRGNLGDRVASCGTPLAGEIGRALAFAAQSDQPGPAVLQQIESLRVEYQNSDREIEQVDFGAGEGTRGEILERTVRTRRLSEFVSVSKSPELCRFLFGLVAEIRPNRVLELGTALGISGAYVQSALVENGAGSLTTMEGAPGVAEVARSTWDRCGLPGAEVILGNFDETLLKALDEPIDIAFIDGNHRAIPTVSYLHQIAPLMTNPGLMVFDDITWTADMRSAWRMVQRHPDAALSIDIGSMGLIVLDPGYIGEPKQLRGTLASCG